MPKYDTLDTRVTKHTGVIMLDRSPAYNALSYDMCVGITNALDAWAEDDAVRQILFYSSASRAFCAGGDIIQIRRFVLGDHLNFEPNYKADEYFAIEYNMNKLIAEYPKPVVVLADGITMGGGAGLLMHASHRMITDKISFGMPEVQIGLFPDVAASYFLRVAGAVGKFLALTGTAITHHDMVASGLVRGYIKAEDAEQVREAICDHVPDDNQANPHGGLDKLLAGFMHQEVTPNIARPEYMAWLDKVLATPRLEDVRDAMADDTHPLAETIHYALTHHAPMSLKLTHALFSADLDGETATLASALRLDHHLAKQMVSLPDFAEGVRATLVDKDKTPHWQHASIDDVDYADVEAMFPRLTYLKEKSHAYH